MCYKGVIHFVGCKPITARTSCECGASDLFTHQLIVYMSVDIMGAFYGADSSHHNRAYQQ